MECDFKIGLIGYTNRTSGIGNINWELIHNLPIDSICSVWSPKGQEKWIDNQMSILYQDVGMFESYLQIYKPDVLLSVETPFITNKEVFERHPEIKKVLIIMQESKASYLNCADLYIYPFPEIPDWLYLPPNTIPLFLPLDASEWRFRIRGGHSFLHIIGYGGVADRRQTEKVLRAFKRLNKAGLIIRSQKPITGLESERIKVICENSNDPTEIYWYGDILIAPDAYNGYGRHIPEAMASGLPVLTTNAPPMNFWVDKLDFLIKPSSVFDLNQAWVKTKYFEVDENDLCEKMDWLLQIYVYEYSKQARERAEQLSWNNEIRQKWLSVLRGIIEV